MLARSSFLTVLVIIWISDFVHLSYDISAVCCYIKFCVALTAQNTRYHVNR